MKKVFIASIAISLFLASSGITHAEKGASITIGETDPYHRNLLSETTDQAFMTIATYVSGYGLADNVDIKNLDLVCGPYQVFDTITVKEAQDYYSIPKEEEDTSKTLGTFTFQDDPFGQRVSIKDINLSVPKGEGRLIQLKIDTKTVDQTKAVTCRAENILFNDQEDKTLKVTERFFQGTMPFVVKNEEQEVENNTLKIEIQEPKIVITPKNTDDVVIYTASFKANDPYTIDDIFFSCSNISVNSELSIEGTGIKPQSQQSYNYIAPYPTYWNTSTIFTNLDLSIGPDTEQTISIKADINTETILSSAPAICNIKAINSHGEDLTKTLHPMNQNFWNGSSLYTYEKPADVENLSYSEAIDYLNQYGIAEGYPDGNFYPNKSINRAELTKIIYNAKDAYINKKPISTPHYSYHSEPCFLDTPITEWFTRLVCNAQRDGWIEGYQDGTFKPANNVTRAEAIKMILVSHHVPLSEEEVADITAHWFNKYKAKALEINLDFGDKNLENIDEEITRGEMSELIFRTHNWLNETNYEQFFKASDEFMALVDELETKTSPEHEHLTGQFSPYSTKPFDFRIACEAENYNLLEEVMTLLPEQEIIEENWNSSVFYYTEWIKAEPFLIDIILFQHNPLHIATNSGCTEIVQQYIDNGSEIDDGDGYGGKAPLHIAANNGDTTMVTLLLENGASVDFETTEGKPLTVETFTNRTTPTGLTPLVFAIQKQDTEMTKLLLDNEANPNYQVSSYSTTKWYMLDLALTLNNLELIDLLREYGATKSSLNEPPYPSPEP